jgi:GNAT superfamily N-acetyltransferase
VAKASSTLRAGEPVEINLLGEVDVSAALQLEDREEWNQTEDDWKRILGLNPNGCFAAFCAGELIGTVTTITYGQDLAWVGMMLVAPQYRGRGVGKQLMREALNYCQRSGIATVKLDATHAGRPLYESLGFVRESGVERWQGTGLSDAQRTPRSFCNDELCLALYKLDEQAFYTSRRELLSSLLQDSCVEPALRTDDSTGSLLGYALARCGARASYVGPIVALERSLAITLLDSLLGRLAGKVFLDIRVGGADIVGALVDRGFAKQRDLTRMSLGRKTTAASNLVFAIAGPELG